MVMQALGHDGTNQMVAVSIPDEIKEIYFQLT
jgi:hypothetical protein